MTPTPQERTEQDALELAREGRLDLYIITTSGQYVRRADYDAVASALVSLAAQSEELRADLEKERAEKAALEAETDRLAADVDYLHQAATGGYSLEDIRARFTNATRAAKAESRYTALEKAARAIAENWRHQILRVDKEFSAHMDALAAALTPKEGE